MNKALIGVIAEDDSDVDCIKHFLKRIHHGKSIGFKKFVGEGCGKICRKAKPWSENFKAQGCNAIILIHDLDRNNKVDLMKKLQAAFLPSPIKKHLICIAIEEMEAWLLADEDAFKQVFNLKKIKLPNKPETVPSPKEYISALVEKATNRKVDYVNTEHNEKIAAVIDIDKINAKCPSFVPFKDFADSIFKKN